MLRAHHPLSPPPLRWETAATALEEAPEARTLQAWASFWARLWPVEGDNWAEEHRERQALVGGKEQNKGGPGISLKSCPTLQSF